MRSVKSGPQQTRMATIGEKLRSEREGRGLSIEDVAHETHIHRNMLVGIEEDDFSMFASVTYAKSFLRNYAEFLEVDTTEVIQALEEGDSYRFGDNELMDEMKKTIKKDHRFKLERKPWRMRRRITPRKTGGAPVLLNFVLLVLIVALGLFYFLGFRTDSVEEAREEMAKGLTKVNPFRHDTAEEVIEPSPTKPVEKAESEVLEETKPVGEEEPKLVKADVPSKPEPSLVTSSSIQKPEVRLQFEDGLPPLSPDDSKKETVPGALKPRGEMEMTFSEEQVKPLSQEEVSPTTNRQTAEPQPVLRPEGTNPEELPEEIEGEDGVIRAVPVAGMQ